MGKIDRTLINEVREDHKNVSHVVGDRVAVITQTFISKRKFTLGVQFWTNNMIDLGVSKNADLTVSKLICTL